MFMTMRRRISVALLVSACSSELSTVDPSGQVDGGVRERDAPVVATSLCTPGDAAIPLTTIPAAPPNGPGIGLLRHTGSTCNLEPAQVVLHNTGAAPMVIDAIAVDDPRFSVEGLPLPYSLAAGDIVALRIAFQDTFERAGTFLSVATSLGCARFPVSGKNIDPEAFVTVTASPYVLSFGHVPAGTTSAPLAFSLIKEARRAPGARSSLGNIGSSSASFRVDTTKHTPHGECSSSSTSVTFVAPAQPGLVQGQLTWEVETAEASVRAAADVIAIVD
jgi:hypothetical protein